jgi:hypothetical protein
VWCAPCRNSATSQAFVAELVPRKTSIRAVSIDISGEYQRAIRDAVPRAEICADALIALVYLCCTGLDIELPR